MLKSFFVFVYYITSIISIIFVTSILKAIFIKNNFDTKSKKVKIIFLISLFFVTTFCLDLLIEGNLYPQNIFDINTFLDFGFWFILGLISLFGSGFFIKIIFTDSKFDRENIISKIFILISLPISFLFLMNLILAWDINPKLSFEDNAKYFTEIICNNNFSYIIENKDRLCSDNYSKNINKQYLNSFNEIINTNFKYNDFEILEYFFRGKEIANPDTAIILLKASSIANIDQEITGLESIKQVDYYFDVRLIENIFKSKFLGNYRRWVIDDFNYSKSGEYSLKEWIDNIKEKIKNNK